MTEPINDPLYWKTRLAATPPDEPHRAIYHCPRDVWERIEARHREVLARTIKPEESVLDCGCGWGRLLTLMPKGWGGLYLGIDLSPDFIRMACERNPGRLFGTADLSQLKNIPYEFVLPNYLFDWAVCISFRPMVIRNQGQVAWNRIEDEIRVRARRILYMEYDELDKGSVE